MVSITSFSTTWAAAPAGATVSPGAGAAYSNAVAVIRAELPDRMRLSCIHEELAQGMGLANDSPDARPSIFNDDEEFAYLTTHDERMLRMLAAAPGETVPRGDLSGAGNANERAVDVQINRLRRKIERDPANPLFLQAVRGIGYRLEEDQSHGTGC